MFDYARYFLKEVLRFDLKFRTKTVQRKKGERIPNNVA